MRMCEVQLQRVNKNTGQLFLWGGDSIYNVGEKNRLAQSDFGKFILN